MTSSTRILLHAFLQQCPTEERQALIRCMAPAERQSVIAISPTYGNPLKSDEDPGKLLAWIHPSWITPFLRTLSEKEIGIFLASLPLEPRSIVGKELLFSGKMPSLSQVGKSFLHFTLARYLTAEVEDLLPIECLPKSPLNSLIALPLATLDRMVDLLGIHDLAAEMKQIIDKQKLLKIEDALSQDQLHYVTVLIQSHEPVVFSSMGILNWNGDKEKLHMLIQQRGANRLAKSLYGQDTSLLWYVLHRLNVEKALIVRKLSSSIDNPRATKLLIQQVVELINYIRDTHE